MLAKSLRALLALLLILHLVSLLAHFHASYASPDASGYFVQARILAEHGALTFEAESPLQYFGVPWLENDDGSFVSRYPPGLGVVLAATWSTLGATAALLVNPILATLTLLFVFLAVRRIAGEGAGLLGAVVMAAVPIANRQAMHADSHTLATFVVAAATWLLLRWRDRPTTARALLVGAALGALPCVRYAEGLMLVGAAVFLWMESGAAGRRRSLISVAAGAAVPLLPLLLVHQSLFGSPFTTAYSLTNEQTAFAWPALVNHALPYLSSLTTEALGPWLLVGIVGAFSLLAIRDGRSLGLLVLGGTLPVGAIYLAYYWGAPGDTTNRFFLPLIPLLLVAAFAGLARVDRRLSGGARRAARVVVAIAVLAQASLFLVAAEERLVREECGTSRGAATDAWLMEHATDGDVVIANRAVQGALERAGRYRLVDDRLLPGGPRRGIVKTKNPNLRFMQQGTDGSNPSPHQHDKADRLRRRYAGVTDVARAKLVLEDLQEWAGGRTIWWLCEPAEIERFHALARQGGLFRRVAELDLPTPGSRLLSALGRERRPYSRKLPYWFIQPPLVAYRWDP